MTDDRDVVILAIPIQVPVSRLHRVAEAFDVRGLA